MGLEVYRETVAMLWIRLPQGLPLSGGDLRCGLE